jgi:radical SAM protein with 4Fe4S-binding SPASM domain
VDGSIKNCPSASVVYGNIYKDSVLEIVQAGAGFQNVWKIAKSGIAGCKVCEHRYICTDCRVFTENPADNYSKPAKCKYDPYTATWSGEMAFFNNK